MVCAVAVLDIACINGGSALYAVGILGAGNFLVKPCAVIVLGVDESNCAVVGEKLLLGIVVVFHSDMVVKMIFRKVCENCTGIYRRADPVLLQRK